MRVLIWNSWMMDQLRSYAYPGDFKNYYRDRILGEVFRSASKESIGGPLEICFIDNHYSNFDYLNYKELHEQLNKYFSPVIFYSDNRIDSILDPEYFQYFLHGPDDHAESVLLNKIYEKEIIHWHENKKLFGLHISRPDQHRLAILYEFHRRGLLEYTDCKIGFSRADLMADEHWRASAIDLMCKNMEVSHLEMLDLIDSLPKSDRLYTDKAAHNAEIGGVSQITNLDYQKSLDNNNFVIEVICLSTTTDNVTIFSEKIERVLALGQPFVIVGSAYMYEALHGCNLKTFNEHWNESWDSITHDRLPDKIREIGETCEYIAKTYTPKEVYTQTKEIVDYNKFLHKEAVSHYKTSERVRRVAEDYRLRTTYDKE